MPELRDTSALERVGLCPAKSAAVRRLDVAFVQVQIATRVRKVIIFFEAKLAFDVVAGVPVAVIIEAAGFLEDAVQLDAAGAHVVDVGLGRFVAVGEAPLLFCLAPEDFVVPVRVEGRVDVDQIDARLRQLSKLLQVIPAIDDARVEER